MKTEEHMIQMGQVSDLCRRKLLNYADSFQELAKSYNRDFFPDSRMDRQTLIVERRLWESRQVLRSHLDEMAKIMKNVAGEVFHCRPMEERKKRLIIRAMREEGIRAESPCYILRENGRESVAVTLSTQKKNDFSAEDAADMISVLLNRRLRLSAESPLLLDKNPRCYELEEEPGFLALTGFARAVKEGEEVSGDNYSVLETEQGRLTVVLSDGTGSGEQAGRDSETVLDLMEKFMEAGYSVDAAAEMINLALFAMGDDCNHPTLDVCDIDLQKGSCELRKAGAAASFLKHEEVVEQLTEGCLPLGIFQQLKMNPIRCKLEDGDYLIMVSDGVVEAFDNQLYEAAICDVIAGIREQNPGEMAEKILRMAVIAGGGRIPDDMTVGVIGIWKT
ncbi:MAG: SpoIIE family protein phosphatase [Acetatifactor sp.]